MSSIDPQYGSLSRSMDFGGSFEELPLETPFAGLTSLSSGQKDYIFTLHSLKFLVSQAQSEGKNYFFCVLEDETAKGSFTDAESFYRFFIEKSRPFVNPLNRTAIMGVRFYVIKKDEKIDQLVNNYISNFCTYEEFNNNSQLRLEMQKSFSLAA